MVDDLEAGQKKLRIKSPDAKKGNLRQVTVIFQEMRERVRAKGGKEIENVPGPLIE